MNQKVFILMIAISFVSLQPGECIWTSFLTRKLLKLCLSSLMGDDGEHQANEKYALMLKQQFDELSDMVGDGNARMFIKDMAAYVDEMERISEEEEDTASFKQKLVWTK